MYETHQVSKNATNERLKGHRYIGRYLAKKYISNDNPYKKEVNDMLVEIKSSKLPSLVRLEAKGEGIAEAEAKAEADKLDSARKLISRGMKIEHVAEDLGLDIKKLSNELFS